MKKRHYVLVFALLVALLSATVASAETFYDDLKGDLSNLWRVNTNNYDGYLTPSADGLEMTINPRNDWASVFSLGISLGCRVEGDFDATVNYEFLNWPTQNGMRFGLGTPFGAVDRISGDMVVIYGTREVYLTDLITGSYQTLDTTDQSGKLRIGRAGSVGYAYVWTGGEWVHMESRSVDPAAIDDYGVGLGLWGHYRTPGVTVRVSDFTLVADNIVCPTLTASIDVKPGSDENPINLKSKGVTPVAVLTTPEFNAADINAATVTVGDASSAQGGHLEDVDADGDMDMVFHFKTQEMGATCGSTELTLKGTTSGGEAFSGSDAITVNCK